MSPEQRQGYAYGLVSYGLWGLVPLYFKQLQIRDVEPLEILMHRVAWCAVFLALIIFLARRWGDVFRVLRTPKLLGLLALSAIFIAINWWQYIRSVEIGQIVQASLGYFITPLLSVVIAMVFLGERMRPLQGLAVAIAAAGCLTLVVARGEVPMIGLSLAISFSLYSVVRKKTPVDGLLGLMIETLVLTPIGLAFLGYWHFHGALVFGQYGLETDLLIAASGIVTALPLLAFGQAARRLPLSSLSFLQFLSPTIQFLIAGLLFGEEFDRSRAIGFAIIWLGVGLFLFDLWRAHWPAQEMPMEPE
jgi:chloramphenicol-sensitive protein RarD